MKFKEFVKNNADQQADIITVFVNETITAQADSILSEHLAEYDELEVVDTEYDFDADNNVCYLDIYCK